MMNAAAYQNLKTYTMLSVLVLCIGGMLYLGRVVLIPFSFALLLSFIFYPMCKWMERKTHRSLAIATVLLILLLIGDLIYQVLATSFSLLQTEVTQSADKLYVLWTTLLHYLDSIALIDAEKQKAMLEQIEASLPERLFGILRSTLYFSISSIAALLMIPIFVALILYYRERLVAFVLAVVPERHYETFRKTIQETAMTYFRFIRGMALVYLAVATLNSIGFLILGIPNAIYLGILASLLTFFPYVGIMIGGSIAVIVAWTTFGSIWYPLGVVGILTVVQYLEANVIFPVVVGQQLKINTFITVVAIFVGGMLWGASGMVLFVPFAAILRILAERMEEWKPLAILLGTEEKDLILRSPAQAADDLDQDKAG